MNYFTASITYAWLLVEEFFILSHLLHKTWDGCSFDNFDFAMSFRADNDIKLLYWKYFVSKCCRTVTQVEFMNYFTALITYAWLLMEGLFILSHLLHKT